MQDQEFETQSKAIFNRLPEVEPSAFFVARVVARVETGGAGRRELLLWRWIAGLALTAALSLAVFVKLQPSRDPLYTYQPYMIQVDLKEAGMELADSAEAELPDGVFFASKNAEIKELRRLRLPVGHARDGKLPFVLIAERAGSMAVLVKMYNSQNQLIGTKSLVLRFEEKRG